MSVWILQLACLSIDVRPFYGIFGGVVFDHSRAPPKDWPCSGGRKGACPATFGWCSAIARLHIKAPRGAPPIAVGETWPLCGHVTPLFLAVTVAKADSHSANGDDVSFVGHDYRREQRAMIALLEVPFNFCFSPSHCFKKQSAVRTQQDISYLDPDCLRNP